MSELNLIVGHSVGVYQRTELNHCRKKKNPTYLVARNVGVSSGGKNSFPFVDVGEFVLAIR